MADLVLRETLLRLKAHKDLALQALEDIRYTHPMLTSRALSVDHAWSARLASMEEGLEEAVFKLFVPAEAVVRPLQLPAPAETT